MIDQNVIAGVLEHIAKGLRENKLEVRDVQQTQQFRPQYDLAGRQIDNTPTGEFSFALQYARKAE